MIHGIPKCGPGYRETCRRTIPTYLRYQFEWACLYDDLLVCYIPPPRRILTSLDISTASPGGLCKISRVYRFECAPRRQCACCDRPSEERPGWLYTSL